MVGGLNSGRRVKLWYEDEKMVLNNNYKIEDKIVVGG